MRSMWLRAPGAPAVGLFALCFVATGAVRAQEDVVYRLKAATAQVDRAALDGAAAMSAASMPTGVDAEGLVFERRIDAWGVGKRLGLVDGGFVVEGEPAPAGRSIQAATRVPAAARLMAVDSLGALEPADASPFRSGKLEAVSGSQAGEGGAASSNRSAVDQARLHVRAGKMAEAQAAIAQAKSSASIEDRAEADLMKGYLDLAQKKDADAKAAFDSVVKNPAYPARVRADAALAEAHLDIRGKNDADAKADFIAIAGNAEYPARVRATAMQRVAALCYKERRNHADALVAYRQLEQATTDPALVAEARMQIAGIAFEMVSDGASTWAEVQELCWAVRDVAEAPRATVATADLMYLEALYKDGNRAAALEECARFRREYADIRREATMAMMWEGIMLNEEGRTDDARRVLLECYNAELKPEEKFAGKEPRAIAGLWLAQIEGKAGNKEAKEKYLAELRAKYPDTPQGQTALILAGPAN